MRRRGRGPLTAFEIYRKWNEALSSHFLVEDNAGHPIYLDPENETFTFLEDRFGLEPGTGRSSLVKAVRGALGHPAERENIFDRFDVAVRQWRREAEGRRGALDLEAKPFPPPVVGLLAVMVIAAQDMDRSHTGGRNISSTNYYEQLRRVLDIDAVHAEKLRRDFEITERFWDAFAWWLDELDGRFGVPSARAASTQRYVGLPMSQALVRAADRRALRRMFQQYGLPPGATIPPAEMQMVITEWIPSREGGASKELASRWGTAEARHRIVDVAVSELESWDGSVETAVRGSGVVADVHRERLMLALEIRGYFEGRENANLGFLLRRDPTPRRWVMEHEGGEVLVDPRPVSASTSFVASYELGADPADLLARRISVRDDNGSRIHRDPRRIVVLARDEGTGLFTEVRRAVSGVSHRILVSPETSDDVMDQLRRLLAATGFSGQRDVEVDGIPEDWLVIDGYTPGRVPEDLTVDPELAGLIASVSTQFHIRGGIRFPGRVRRWHSDAVPEIIVTVGTRAGSHRLTLTDLASSAQPRTLVADITTPCVVELPADIQDGDHRIELMGPRRELVQSETLRLRSGAQPHYEGWAQRQRLGHTDEAVDAVRARSVHGDPAIRGAVAVKPRPLAGMNRGTPPWIDWATCHVSRPTVRHTIVLPDPGRSSCLTTGRHRYHYPTMPGGKPTGPWQTGVCEQCGAVRRDPTSAFAALKPEVRAEIEARRGRKVRDLTPALSGGEAQPVAQSLDMPEIGESAIPAEVVLDAMVHVYSGEHSALSALTLQAPDVITDQSRILQDFAALGLVEVSRDDRFRRDRWEVCAPALVTLADDRVALTGAWPLADLAALEAVVEDLGARLDLSTSLRSLSTIDGATREELFEYTDLEHVLDGGRSYEHVAADLPDLSSVAAALERRDATMVSGSWQRYSVRELAWTDVAGWGAPGLYRRDRGYRRDYWYRSARDLEENTAAPVDVELGKHLAALDARQPLLAYDEADHALTVPLGARLPELYERAAVLCSGRAPDSDPASFSMRYPGVPPVVAATLHGRMTS